MRAATLVALIAAAAGLGACADRDDGGRVAGICAPFAETPATPAPALAPGVVSAAPVGDPAAPLDDCLHRWGYALARADDTSSDVAAIATVAACSGVLTRWNQDTMAASQNASLNDAPSLTTGEPMNPFAAHHAFARSKALFYVVQARAGNCGAPAFKDGAPAPATAKK